MPNHGYFVTTDISGYTEYLTKSELEHAHAILQSLFEAQLENIRHPLLVSGFRGDAILMYASDTNFINPQSFVESLENLYIVYMDTLRQMQFNTTCTCRACANMKKLDLKMCIHYGEYMIQKLAGREELLGADVIIPHRMSKNNVVAETGIKPYALFSEAAAQQLKLAELCADLLPYQETYEHIGEVKMLVHNLGTAWERELARKSLVVEPRDAWISVEIEFPYPPSLLWDYLTNPALEASALGLISVTREDNLSGRTGEGANFHCAHSSGDFYNKVVDWKPFEHYTVRQSGIAGLEYFRMIRLVAHETQTKFQCCFSPPSTPAPDGLREQLQFMASEGYKNLGPAIGEAVASGKVTAPGAG
jgi:hypothetical protein